MESLRKVIVAGAFAVLASACGGGDSGPLPTPSAAPDNTDTPKTQLQQQAFASCAAFKDYYAQALAEEYFSGYSYNRNCFGCEPATLEAVDFAQGDAVAAPAAPEAAPQREISDTNTQEAGVDEADIIETSPDGQTLYVLRREARELLVIDISDVDNLSILARLGLSETRQPSGMFLDAENQRLAIILTPGYIYYLDAPAVSDAGFAGPAGKSSIAPPDFEDATEVRFFDVSDRSNPRALESLRLDGQFVDARRIGARIHLVTQFGLPYPASLYDNENFRTLAYEEYPRAYADQDRARMDALKPQIRALIEQAVAALPAEDLLPRLGTEASGMQPLACTQIQHPAVSTRMGLLMISSIDSDGSALSTLGSINNAWQLYASAQSLYLSQHSGGWWFDPQQTQQTAIYRYDISNGSAEPGGLGLVDGWLGNRYQMSEFEDHLRVVTTEARPGADTQDRWINHHHLSVLSTASMTLSGQVEDFVDVREKPRETIRATRFVGNKGYVVTFEQIDPLFTFDLSDPAAPLKVGELEIPGFSSYMHPLGDDHLLTIGRNAGDNGVGSGRAFQLQIFDVSDLAQPQLVASAEPALGSDDYAFSLAEHDPHAFTFSQTAALLDLNDLSGVLSIPVQIAAAESSDALSGFIAYRIGVQGSEASIDEYARIDHKDSGDNGQGCPPNADELPPEGCNGFAPVIYNEPLRSVIIQDTAELLATTTLLTLSSSYLKVLDASADTPRESDTLDLRP